MNQESHAFGRGVQGLWRVKEGEGEKITGCFQSFSARTEPSDHVGEYASVFENDYFSKISAMFAFIMFKVLYARLKDINLNKSEVKAGKYLMALVSNHLFNKLKRAIRAAHAQQTEIHESMWLVVHLMCLTGVLNDAVAHRFFPGQINEMADHLRKYTQHLISKFSSVHLFAVSHMYSFPWYVSTRCLR